MKSYKDFNKNEINNIIKMYQEGISKSTIKDKYNCSIGLIKTILIKNNINLRTKNDNYNSIRNGKYSEKKKKIVLEKDKIIKLYQEGMNLLDIANLYNYKSPTEIRKLLIRNNIALRNPTEVYFTTNKDKNIERDDKISRLYKQGLTQGEIAKEFKMSRTGIQRIVNKLDITSKNKPGIEYIVRDRLKKEIEMPYGIKISNKQSMKYKDKDGHSMGIDILIEDFNLGIEVNDIRSHNSTSGYIEGIKPKDKNYHKNKTLLANEQGLDLIHIFEWEVWDETKFNILISIIKNRLNLTKSIGASRCKLKIISSKDANKFLDENHLQGGCKQSFINYGLYYKDELVFVMTFSKPRNTIGKEETDYELLRMCSKINYNIKFGASRILSHFRKDFPGSIKSFGELTHMNSSCYEKLGFRYIRTTSPGYKWVKLLNGWNKTYMVLTRNQTQKHKLVKQGFDKTLTETQIMESQGFKKVYDCGNKVFILDKFQL